MKNEAVLRSEGIEILIKGLGLVDAERFVASMLREPFDYTKWQRNLWNGETIEQIHAKAAEYERTEKTG